MWKLGWSPRPGGEFGTTLPEIPLDFLQEKDVFREFLYRINTLGKHRVALRNVVIRSPRSDARCPLLFLVWIPLGLMV